MPAQRMATVGKIGPAGEMMDCSGATDYRICCQECRHWRERDGSCLVAEKRRDVFRVEPRKVKGHFPRGSYRPRPDVPVNCEFGERVCHD